MPLRDKTACSFAYIDSMGEEKYHDAAYLAQVMLETHGDVTRHHEMMLTLNLRRENLAAALENCNELISYGRLKGADTAEYESHRVQLLQRLERTRTYLAARFWDEVQKDPDNAAGRYTGTPLVLAGEAVCHVSADSHAVYLVFQAGKGADNRIACRLVPSEKPFLAGLEFPARVTVHGYFLSASAKVILLYPCRFLNAYDAPWQ